MTTIHRDTASRESEYHPYYWYPDTELVREFQAQTHALSTGELVILLLVANPWEGHRVCLCLDLDDLRLGTGLEEEEFYDSAMSLLKMGLLEGNTGARHTEGCVGFNADRMKDHLENLGFWKRFSRRQDNPESVHGTKAE